MRIFKNIVTYLFWIVVSILIALVYAQCIINPNAVSEDGFWYLLHLFFKIGMLQMALYIGLIIAFCFILIDVFYLKKNLKYKLKLNKYRVIALFVITVFVIIVHYILEKIIDVI